MGGLTSPALGVTMSVAKEIKELVGRAEDQDWRVDDRGNKILLYSPDRVTIRHDPQDAKRPKLAKTGRTPDGERRLCEVMDWMVTLDTPNGVARDDDQLMAFSDALDDVRRETGASTSFNTKTGVLSATFSVPAELIQEAVDRAVTFFNDALNRTGLPEGNIAHIEAEPLENREHAYA
jgi:hypothetical protein